MISVGAARFELTTPGSGGRYRPILGGLPESRSIKIIEKIDDLDSHRIARRQEIVARS